MMSRPSGTGFLLVLLALLAQLGWNTRLPDLAALELAGMLNPPGVTCHGGAGNGQQAPGNPADDCMVCPCCLGTVLPAALPVPIVCLPPPVAIPAARFVATPPATGLPPVRFAIARPRGPPAQA